MNKHPITALAAAVLLAACSKSEPPSAAATPPAATAAAAPAPAAATGSPPADPAVPKDSRLLERLARQEAAYQAISPSMQEPAAKPASTAKPPAANPAATSSPAVAPTAQAAKPMAASAPPPAAAGRTAPPALPAATSAPVTPANAPAKKLEPAAAPVKKPEPAPAPMVAKAAPAAEPPSRVLTRVDPDFPSEAVREGYDSGLVRVRLNVDAEGNVTRVDIVESRPRRVFDRAVTNALSQWKFTAGKAGRAVETEIAFRR